ncbi:MAG: hypothetical protein K0B15_16330 [Lentimicrobium sp.]|nr:hypothetical protein [Lentimicrobium sp.]
MFRNIFNLLLISSLSVFSIISCITEQKKSFPFAWFLGSYTDTVLNFHEKWEILGDTMLIGTGYSVNERDTGFYENLLMTKSDNFWYYIVMTGGQQTIFRLTNEPGDSLVFENSENQFPKRITYLRRDEGKILAIIENPGNPESQVTFSLIPQK